MAETSNKRKVIVVGFDGAPPHLLRRWVEQGHLPNFARLYREGVGGIMASTPQCNSAPAWSSFATGVNPGRHGVFSFMNRVPHSYRAKRIDAGDRHGATFWDIAGSQDRRCAVLNVPVTYPVRPVNGLQVGDWLCPALTAPGATYPADLADEITRRMPDFAFHPDVKRHFVAGRHAAALKQIHRGIEQKAAVGRMLYDREDWDLFVLVFVETDAAQHYYLHTADEQHPLYAQAQAQGLAGALLEVYRQADEVLGEYMARVDDNTTLLVMSDHGASANTQGRAFMRSFLHNIGLLQMKERMGPGERGRRALTRVRKWGFETLNAHLPKSVKVKLNAVMPKARERLFADAFTQDVDWPHTRAYSYYWETDPFVNVRGRDPDGIVSPDGEYSEVCDFIVNQLLQAREEKTGEPVVDEVLYKRDHYHGEYYDLAPDLIVRWRENLMMNGIVSRVNGSDKIARAEIRDDTIGAHHPDATLLMWGRDVRPGAATNGATIMDLAPSILALLGCAVPDNLDGHVLADALDVAVEQTAGVAAGVAEPERIYSAEEEAEVESRLRNLGYL